METSIRSGTTLEWKRGRTQHGRFERARVSCHMVPQDSVGNVVPTWKTRKRKTQQIGIIYTHKHEMPGVPHTIHAGNDKANKNQNRQSIIINDHVALHPPHRSENIHTGPQFLPVDVDLREGTTMPRNQLQVGNWGRTVAGRDAHGLG